MGRVRDDLAELVAMRSVADPRQFPPEECARAAQWVLDAFAEVGFARPAAGADGRRQPGRVRVAARAAGRARRCCSTPTTTCSRRWTTSAWRTPPFELTERDGRWYGRGAADCKGNIMMHLTALRALGDDVPVTLKLIVEGSEEQGTGGLEEFVPANADLLRADAILVCDTGNAAVGVPPSPSACAGWPTWSSPSRRSPARCTPACSAAPRRTRWPRSSTCSRRCATSAGNTTIDGLDSTQTWTGVPYPADAVPRRRRRARRCRPARRRHGGRPGVGPPGGHDSRHRRPPVVGSAAAIQPQRRRPAQPAGSARAWTRRRPRTPLIAHLGPPRRGGCRSTVEREAIGAPFRRHRRTGVRARSLPRCRRRTGGR